MFSVMGKSMLKLSILHQLKRSFYAKHFDPGHIPIKILGFQAKSIPLHTGARFPNVLLSILSHVKIVFSDQRVKPETFIIVNDNVVLFF